MIPTFEDQITAIWIEQMQHITDLAELDAWAKERAEKFKLCAHVDELRQAYLERKVDIINEHR